MNEQINWTDIEPQIHARLLSSEFYTRINQLARIPLAGDVFLTFCIYLADDEEETVCMPITTGIAEACGITTDMLREAAMENDSGNYVLMPISQVLMPGTEWEDDVLYVISNTSSYFGAAGVLDPDIQQTLRERYPDGCYVLPSSVHEVLVTAPGMVCPDDLSTMIREINRDEVAENERLSDSLFWFDGSQISVVA